MAAHAKQIVYVLETHLSCPVNIINCVISTVAKFIEYVVHGLFINTPTVNTRNHIVVKVFRKCILELLSTDSPASIFIKIPEQIA